MSDNQSFSIPIPDWLPKAACLAGAIVALIYALAGPIAGATIREPIQQIDKRVDKVETYLDERRKVRDADFKELRGYVAELRAADAQIITRLEVQTEILKRIETNQKR